MNKIRQQTRRTVQSHVRDESGFGMGMLWNMALSGELLSPWWSQQRDLDLTKFALKSDHFQGAEWMISTKLTGVPFRVEARDRSVKHHQKLADEYQAILENMVQFGQGWGDFWDRFYSDLWETDNGGFGEILGAGNPGGPRKGAAIGLLHLDSHRCTRMNNPEYPVRYQAGTGKITLFHHTRVVYQSQRSSARADMNGVGHCWLSRANNNVQQLVDQDVYYQEALGSRPIRQMMLTKGIDPDNVIAAVKRAEEGMDNQGLSRYSKTVIAGDEHKTDIGIDTIPFTFLPEGYDKQQQTSLAMFAIALAGGFPPRWLWPATAAGATKADAMFQHISGSGGGALWHLNMMQDLLSYTDRSLALGAALPPKFLPKELRLVFDYQDDEQDRQQAEIKSTRATTRKVDLEDGVITVRVAREQALSSDDITEAQFNQMELEEGRLPDGADLLTLFDSVDPLLVEMLDLGVEEPLLIDVNDPIEMIIAIEAAALAAQARMVQARSSKEKAKAEQALGALGKLKGIYDEIVIREIEEEIAAEQETGEFELPETTAEAPGEGESAETPEEETEVAKAISAEKTHIGNQLYIFQDAIEKQAQVQGELDRTQKIKWDSLVAHMNDILTRNEVSQRTMEQSFAALKGAYLQVNRAPEILNQQFKNQTSLDQIKDVLLQRTGKKDQDTQIELVTSDIACQVFIASLGSLKDDVELGKILIDEYFHNLKAFNFGVKFGRIRGGLFRGAGGKFASEADVSAIKSEILGRLIARLRAARTGGTGKGGAAKKPKKAGGGGGSSKPDKAKLAREKLAAEAKTRAETFAALDLDAAAMDALGDFIAGGDLDPATAQGLAQQGFVKFDSSGTPVTTSAGRAIISAATKGDKRKATDAASKAREQVAKTQERADKKRAQADESRESATELQGRAEDATGEADELDDEADELLAQAGDEQDEGKAEKLRDKAAKVQERAEKKREQATGLQDRAAEQDERAATLDTDAGTIEATIGGGELPQGAPDAGDDEPGQAQESDRELLERLVDAPGSIKPENMEQLREAGLIAEDNRLTDAGRELRTKAIEEPPRGDFEQEIDDALVPVFREAQIKTLAALQRGVQPDDEDLRQELNSLFVPILTSAALFKFGLFENQFSLAFDAGDTQAEAETWARQHAATLAGGLITTTQRIVNGVPPDATQEETEATVDRAFNENRREQISITETTVALLFGALLYQRSAANVNVKIDLIWFTREDELVCPICRPLNRKPQKVWSQQFPDGAPAHVRCRCDVIAVRKR